VQTDTPGARVALQYFAPPMPLESRILPACFYSDTSRNAVPEQARPRQLSHARLYPDDVRICFKAVSKLELSHDG